MTRTHYKYVRCYANGVDISGYARATGQLGTNHDSQDVTAYSDGAKNVVVGQPEIIAGPVNAVLDNDAAGLFNLAMSAAQTLDFMAAIGVLAEPAAGNPVFAWTWEQTNYQGDGNMVNIPLKASFAATLNYSKPWGALIHAKGAETAADSSAGVDDNDATATTKGGIFVYHLFSNNGTGGVTLSLEEADTNVDGSFAALTDATSGVIHAESAPKYGMIELETDAAVKEYIRWQIAFAGNTTTATFACAFIRG
jgi:hypothetical protein